MPGRRIALLAGLALAAFAGPASAATVVSIQFDDGVADQYGTLPILNAHGMHATFYVNSGVVGDAAHMSCDQVTDLATAGNEIAGHTLTHANLKKLKTPAARQEVCAEARARDVSFDIP